MTKNAKKLLEFLRKYIEKNKISPNYEEMKEHMGLKSKSSIFQYLEYLEELGHIKKDNLIDDSKSYLDNHKKFVEHRHDQSAFSLICKKKGVYSISSAECEWAEIKNKRIWRHLEYFPIHARRDKKYNIFKRFLNRQTKNLRRLIN